MKKLLLLPVLLLMAATYGPPFSVSDFSSLTNRPNPSAANPVGIVLGRTNAYDGGGGMFIYNPLATNTVDGENYLPATTAGRWIRVDRLLLTANSPLLYSNGALSLSELTNYFSFLAGTNMQVTVTSNAVTYAMTNTASGGGSSSTNWYAYVVNTSQLIEKFGLIGNDSSDSYGQLIWNVAATTNLLGGTNIFASIADHKITNVKLDYIPTNSLLGSDLSTTAGSFANVGTVYIGANLLLSESGGVNTLSAITSSGTNTWQIGVDGVVVTTPNLADGANVTVSSSGTNVTFNLTATGVSAGTYSNVVITLDDRGRVTSASSGNLFTTLTNTLTAGTNIVLTYGAGTIGINSYATGGGGGGGDVYTSSNNVFTGTNTFTEQVIFDDLLVTNLTAENLILPFADGLVGSDSNSNAFKVTIGANLTYSSGTLSATGGGGATNGTAVTVDGGADLTRANFADSSLVTFTASGTNITASIPDDSLALGTKTTGNFVAGVSGTANEVTVTGGSGSEASTGTISLPSTIDLGGKTSFELPNSAAPTTDAFGELAGDDNAWASGRGALQFFDGTANTWLVGVLSSDTPSNGQVPTWNTGGTITWETPSAGGGSSTNILVNSTLVQNANLINSSTLLWNVSGSNITATVTNVPGTTTSNVLQWVGSAYFIVTNNSTIGDFSTFSTNGIINGLTCVDCQNDSPGIIQFDFPSRSTNYIWTFMPEGNVNGFVAYEAEGYRTATSLRIKIHEAAGSVFFTGGYWMRFDFWDKVAVGGSGSGGGGETNTASNLGTPSSIVQGLYNSKSGVDLRFRSIEAGSGITLSSNANTVSIALNTNIIVSTVNGHNYYDQENGDVFCDGYQIATISYAFYPVYSGGVISSGSADNPVPSATRHSPSILSLSASGSANSGYYFRTGPSVLDLSYGGDEHYNYVEITQTNDVIARLGFFDVASAGSPTDGAHVLFSQGWAIGLLANAGSFTYTGTSNQLVISTNLVKFSTKIPASADRVTFQQETLSGSTWTTNWTDTITNTIPGGENLTGFGTLVYRIGASNGLVILKLDAMGKRNIKTVR